MLFISFLILFSYVVLSDLYPVYLENNQSTSFGMFISLPEVFLIIWVFSYLIEEIRKVIFVF
jgi:hypothetical protein